MDQTRRSLLSLFPALCATAALSGEKAQGQAKPKPRTKAKAKEVIPSFAYPLESLPVHGHENLSRPILNGLTHLNYPLEAHETTLQPGSMPHPPHHHLHEEMFLIREGTLEVTINGKSTRIDAGGAAYVASNSVHGIKNVGATPANYFVVAFGTDKA